MERVLERRKEMSKMQGIESRKQCSRMGGVYVEALGDARFLTLSERGLATMLIGRLLDRNVNSWTWLPLLTSKQLATYMLCSSSIIRSFQEASQRASELASLGS